jgi:hypothetical protein
VLPAQARTLINDSFKSRYFFCGELVHVRGPVRRGKFPCTKNVIERNRQARACGRARVSHGKELPFRQLKAVTSRDQEAVKSHLASVAFPAWCLGHDPSGRIFCVSYAQDLAGKLSHDSLDLLVTLVNK